jgi:hypothetical protein
MYYAERRIDFNFDNEDFIRHYFQLKILRSIIFLRSQKHYQIRHSQKHARLRYSARNSRVFESNVYSWSQREDDEHRFDRFSHTFEKKFDEQDWTWSCSLINHRFWLFENSTIWFQFEIHWILFHFSACVFILSSFWHDVYSIFIEYESTNN